MWANFVKEFHRLLAYRHQGIAKTFERITRDYYVPRLRTIIEEVISNCNLCQKTKGSNYAPQGLLQPNKVLKQPWEVITIDFITKLPLSKEPFTRVTYNII